MPILDDYTWLERWRQLPRAGGMLDQEARFVRAVAIIDDELGRLEHKKGGGHAG